MTRDEIPSDAPPSGRVTIRLENAVHKDICAGRLTLEEGRAIFLGDFWIEYHKRFDK